MGGGAGLCGTSGKEPPPPALSSLATHLHSTNWQGLLVVGKRWLRQPMNFALIAWLLCVGASAAMVILLLLGFLDRAIPSAASRDRWIEINSQILNALCTLMSVYQHPTLFHHLTLLRRWRPGDAAELRSVYCKDASVRRHERRDIAIVVVLLHLTCLCQYGQCALYWGYSSVRRPELADDALFIVGIVAPVVAGVYAVFSPLGKEAPPAPFAAVPSDDTGKNLQRDSPRPAAQWAGDMFDCSSEPTTFILALSCTCCLHAWNLERLGFGSAYMHAFTFLLLVAAPFLVCGLSARRIQDDALAGVVRVAGVGLSFLGLLYGGYWRIQMRRKYGLPKNTIHCCCCKSSAAAEYARWLFSWPCALAQEVRTGNELCEAQENELRWKLLNREDSVIVDVGDEPDATVTPPVLPAMTAGEQINVIGLSVATSHRGK